MTRICRDLPLSNLDLLYKRTSERNGPSCRIRPEERGEKRRRRKHGERMGFTFSLYFFGVFPLSVCKCTYEKRKKEISGLSNWEDRLLFKVARRFWFLIRTEEEREKTTRKQKYKKLREEKFFFFFLLVLRLCANHTQLLYMYWHVWYRANELGNHFVWHLFILSFGGILRFRCL